MSRPSQLELGWEFKRQGQDRAVDGQRGWIDEALGWLRAWNAGPAILVGDEFRLEQFRAWALAKGMTAPRSHQAWGAIPRVAIKAGLLEWTGRYELATSPATHAHPVRVYRRRGA